MVEEKGFDLVMVSDKVDLLVCRIIDYGKYLFEQKKKVQDVKCKQYNVEVKEVKMCYKIEEYDYNVCLFYVKCFFEFGDKVKVIIMF